ncbi:hypothetical protein HYW75_02595 [Candidatus Pacearchaeota archaeon]|nr:hypothetical protein [Candidatus Pacearchaeota archaeon]
MKKYFILFVLILAILIFINSTFSVGAAVINGTCTESDKGVNYNEKGDAEGNWLTNRTEYLSVSDECEKDQKTLIEYYCEENFLYSVKRKCPNFCQDGACVMELITKSEISIVEENNTQVSNNTTNGTLNENINLTMFDENNTEQNETNDTTETKSKSQNTFVEVSDNSAENNSNSNSNQGFIKKIINWLKGLFSKKE